MRVPGIGFRGANRIVAARRYHSLSYEDLQKMKIVLKRAAHFIICGGKFFGQQNLSAVKNLLLERSDNFVQLSMFSDSANLITATTGEL